MLKNPKPSSSNVPLKHETLCLAKGRFAVQVEGLDAIIRDQAGDTSTNIGERGEEDERVRNGAQSLEKGEGDEDEEDPKKRECCAHALHCVEGIDLACIQHGELAVFSQR